MFDTARNRVGEYRDRVGTRVYLRPVGGGKEWTADPKYVREATSVEMLSVRVAKANARSRGEIS
nr:hypothetical protein [Streptomyces sp. ISL-12]